MSKRIVELTRTTKETDIICRLNLDGNGIADVETGIGFFDHMLTTLAKHSRFDLRLSCKGDLSIDDHHSVEDCALIIGNCLDDALGERQGIARFACAHVPLDEALCRAVVDLRLSPLHYARQWCLMVHQMCRVPRGCWYERCGCDPDRYSKSGIGTRRAEKGSV